jgi:hypothetical protein
MTDGAPLTRQEYWHQEAASKGYGPICATLSEKFGTPFEVTMTGGNNWALVARIEGFELLISDAGDWVGDLTPVGEEGHGYGISLCPFEDGEPSGCASWYEDEGAKVDDLPAVVQAALNKLVASS